jgi:hypothetical protein
VTGLISFCTRLSLTVFCSLAGRSESMGTNMFYSVTELIPPTKCRLIVMVLGVNKIK